MDLMTKITVLAVFALLWMFVNLKSGRSGLTKFISFWMMWACLAGSTFFILILLGVIPWSSR